MSSTMQSLNISETIPSSIKSDEQVQALAKTFMAKILDIDSKIDMIRILPNLSKVSDEVLDLLAWQYSVDFYDESFSREIKENLVRKSIVWHMKKGTPGMLKEVITTLYSEANVLENWEYEGGEPYHFKVELTGYLMDVETRKKIDEYINEIKNTRSWLDEVAYDRSIQDKGGYVGGIARTIGSTVIEPDLGVSFGELNNNNTVGGFVKTRTTVFI